MYKSATAQTVALLVVAEEQQPECHCREEAIYHVIDRCILLEYMSDEEKADVYARIVEDPRHTRYTFDLAQAISAALEANEVGRRHV